MPAGNLDTPVAVLIVWDAKLPAATFKGDIRLTPSPALTELIQNGHGSRDTGSAIRTDSISRVSPPATQA